MSEKCPRCNGTGKISAQLGRWEVSTKCPKCKGAGIIWREEESHE